ncbi:MAG: PspC domain-containing protein [Eggerthellaceae bacterium]
MRGRCRGDRPGGSVTSEKRLLRSRKALIGGVCAGVADYFNVDPVIVRIIMVVFTLASAGCWASHTSCCGSCRRSSRRRPLDVHPSRCIPRRTGRSNSATPRKTESGAQNAPNPAQSGRLALCASPYASAAHVPPGAPGKRIARLCRCACRCLSFVCASGEPFA